MGNMKCWMSGAMLSVKPDEIKIAKSVFLVLVFMFLIGVNIIAANAQTASKKLSVSIFAELSVTDPSRTAQALADFSESVGGYYIRKSNRGVSLRLPAEMRNRVEDILRKNGILLRYNVNSSDITKELLVLRRQLESRKRLLAEYNRLIATAGFSSTLALERELMTVVSEMENLRGRINRMENDYQFLRLDINFFSDEPARPVMRRSYFNWINRMGFYNFVGGRYAR